MCRKPGEENIFSTKTFLLSSDRGLFRWDSKYNTGNVPVVMLPSQWLSILLRYVSRTSDDFRSFVSFLNIQSKEGLLSAEQIRAILSGISEMTDRVEQQRYLLDVIIENEFKSGAGEKTNEQIKAIAKNDANRILQKQLSEVRKEAKELKKGLEDMKSEFADHKAATELQLKTKTEELTTANEKISELKGSIDSLTQTHTVATQSLTAQHDKEMSEARETINRLNKTLNDTNSRNEFEAKRRHKIWWLSIGIIVVLVLIAWFFLTSPESSAPMGRLLKAIDELDETRKVVARTCLGFVVSLVLIPLCINLFKAIRSKYEET